MHQRAAALGEKIRVENGVGKAVDFIQEECAAAGKLESCGGAHTAGSAEDESPLRAGVLGSCHSEEDLPLAFKLG